MGIHEELDQRLKAAMRAKDERALDVIRMIRSQAKKVATTEGRELDDKLYLATIQSYVKQMKRAREEYEEAEGGQEMAAKLGYEIEYLEPFLPKMLNEQETRALVKEVIDANAVSDKRQAGRVVGLMMKTHKGEVDPALVKQLADALLS